MFAVTFPTLIFLSGLLDDAELQVGDARGLDHPCAFQFDVISADMVEHHAPRGYQD